MTYALEKGIQFIPLKYTPYEGVAMHVLSIYLQKIAAIASAQVVTVCVVFAVLCALATPAIAEDAVEKAAYGPEKQQKPPVDADIVTHAPGPPQTKKPPEPPAKDWIFDPSRYSNSPTTGDRMVQYQQKTPALRDPNAFYDSPHESYPFSPAPYGPYPRYAPPRYSGSTAYDQYSLPYRPYYPYGADYYGP